MNSTDTKNTIFIAHFRKKDGRPQSLLEHLEETSKKTGEFCSKIGLQEQGELIGFLHDLGKYSEDFQRYIKSAVGLINSDEDDYVDVSGLRGKIDHSSAGAQFIFENFSTRDSETLFVAQVLSLCVASHHSGLCDCISPKGDDVFSKRMSKPDEKTHKNEVCHKIEDSYKGRLDKFFTSKNIVKNLAHQFKALGEKNKDSKDSVAFKHGLLLRFLYSCLIDADRLNTSDFEYPTLAKMRNNGNYISWDILIERLNIKLKNFENKKNKNKVDVLRQEISKHCFEFSDKEKGLYQLTVPTGGGKTLASLRFALHHAKKHKMERVIYVLPYTSIIDQNAEEARKILEEKNKSGKFIGKIVLEHHSNLTPEEENKTQRILSEDWDSPIVFTTLVQVLEALFGSSTNSARRMHQMANSIIIFDEVQAMPVKCIQMFNMAVCFFVKICKSTVLLCTATQPLLDKVKPESRSLIITSGQQMMPDVKKLFKELKRFNVFDRTKSGGWNNDEIKELIAGELKESVSVLIVVNTKKSARDIYKKCEFFKQQKIYHLSTDMCPTHRLAVLEDIKDCLNKEEPVVCISTQLIEAGVDIDFGAVIRFLAGLDSLVQAAGRCNRHGRPKQGRVSIINSAEELIDRLQDIRIGKEKSERILAEFKINPESFDNDLLGLKAMERYYQYYFYDRSEIMAYPVGRNSIVGADDNIFNLLSINSNSVSEYGRKNKGAHPPIPLRQSFMAAAKVFNVIDSPTRGVVVPYGQEGQDIIDKLCSVKEVDKQYELLKKAQRYSINIFSNILQKLQDVGAIHEAQKGSGILYLHKQYYSKNFGLSETPVESMEFKNV